MKARLLLAIPLFAATAHTRVQSAVFGKAMTSVPDGQGMVLVLVTLQ